MLLVFSTIVGNNIRDCCELPKVDVECLWAYYQLCHLCKFTKNRYVSDVPQNNANGRCACRA